MTTRLEPVAWRWQWPGQNTWGYADYNLHPDAETVQPLYAAAPAPDGMREAIEVVTEWLEVAKETPKPLHSSLNYVPISTGEFGAIERILALLAAKETK